MSINKLVLAVVTLSALAACGRSEPEEVVVVEPAPVVVEPVTGKF